MRGVNILRYSHTLSSGEELMLCLAFSTELEDNNVFIHRARYMYETMQDAIKKRESQLKGTINEAKSS